MPLLFWIEIAAYTIATVSALALALMVIGTGFGRALNRLFTVFVLLEGIWAVSAVFLRLALWLQMGEPAFWLELAAMALNAMGPLLLMFTVRYLNREETRHADMLASLGLILLAFLAIPVFSGQMLFSPRLEASGVVTYGVSTWGFLAPLVPIPYFLWSFLLFWRERHQGGNIYLASSVLILLGGFVLGGVLRSFLPVPILSLSVTISVGVLGYGAVNKQLFNPLRDLTQELERRVEERTQKLTETANRLEEMNAAFARRSMHLEAAAQVAREAAAIRDVDELLGETVTLISERFGFYHAGIFLMDEAGEYAVLKAASSEDGRRMLARGYKVETRRGSLRRVVALEEPYVVPDGEGADFLRGPDLTLTRSEVVLPLKAHDRVIGVLDVQAEEAEAFGEGDVSVLQTLADQISLAIENARLLEEAEDRLQEIDMLLRRESREGWGALVDAADWKYVYDGVTVSRQREEAASDVDPQLMVPLEVRGEAIGNIQLALPDRPLSSEDKALVQSIVEETGQALESARLFGEMQKTLEEMETLNEITSSISQSLQLEDVLDTVLRRVLSIADFEAGLVSMIDSDRGRLYLAAHHELPGALLQLFDEQDLEGTLCHEVYRRGELMVIEDLSQGAPVDAEKLVEMELRSYLGVPLESRGETVGTLCLFGYAPRSPEADVLSLLRSVGQQMGVAIENARLFRKARRRAARERMAAEIASRVRSATDVDAVLRTAIRELGRSLRASGGWIRLESGNGKESVSSDDR